MKNRFEKYVLFTKKNGLLIDFNPKVIQLADEAFELFKSLYDTHYGSIEEDENLVSIHTGGWSDNEALIEEFKETGWWIRYHKITVRGGHYFFNTDTTCEKDWKIVKTN
jgi:hypothetical protein